MRGGLWEGARKIAKFNRNSTVDWQHQCRTQKWKNVRLGLIIKGKGDRHTIFALSFSAPKTVIPPSAGYSVFGSSRFLEGEDRYQSII